MITYDLPKELEETVKGLMEELEWMIPPWCFDLKVELGASDEGTRATILTRYEYRDALLTLRPPFLSDKDKIGLLKHELTHLWVAPLSDFGRALIKYKFKDDNFIFSMWREREEAIVEDIGYVIKSLSQSKAVHRGGRTDRVESGVKGKIDTRRSLRKDTKDGSKG